VKDFRKRRKPTKGKNGKSLKGKGRAVKEVIKTKRRRVVRKRKMLRKRRMIAGRNGGRASGIEGWWKSC
jgi:hypothetical protein